MKLLTLNLFLFVILTGCVTTKSGPSVAGVKSSIFGAQASLAESEKHSANTRSHLSRAEGKAVKALDYF